LIEVYKATVEDLLWWQQLYN